MWLSLLNYLKQCIEMSVIQQLIVSGDTDLKPSIEACKRNFPEKEIIIIFPIYRTNTELKNIVQRSWTIKPKVYFRYQLNDIIQLGNGRQYFRPKGW